MKRKYSSAEEDTEDNTEDDTKDMEQQQRKKRRFKQKQYTLFTSEIVSAFDAAFEAAFAFAAAADKVVWKQNDERLDAWVIENMPDICKKKHFNTYIKDDMRKPNVDYMYIFNTHTQKMTGLMIVNRGECGAYPTFWTLQLLCGVEGTKSARTLLGLYCFALKRVGQPIGLLELAGNYKNLRAYCLYTKFGFMEPFKTHPPFEWKDCDAFSSLPLISLMDNLTYPDLFNVVKGSKQTTIIENELCNKIPRDKQQEYIDKVLLPQWRENKYDKYYFKRGFFKYDTAEGEDSNF